MSERLEEIKQTINHPNHTEHNGQEEIYFMVSDNDFNWLIKQAERVEKLETQRNERTQLLNAEVARNVRYKKVLEKIVNHAGKGIDIDYELWKTAKKALEGEE